MKLTVIVSFVLMAALAVTAQDTPDSAQWNSLKKLSTDASFAYRIEGWESCLYGKLRRVTSRSITIETDKEEVVISREDLQRVWDGSEANDFIYTRYSSWEDVKTLTASMNKNEFVRVTDKRGLKREGRASKISDSEITLQKDGKIFTIPKADIAAVDYIRLKPVGDDANYEARHGLFLRPETWSYAWGIPPKMAVRLYDSSVSETLQPPVNCSWIE
jgi:hypothetical protein